MIQVTTAEPDPAATGETVRAPVRVLLANDHHGWSGTTLHGIGKLFLLWLPRFDPRRVTVTTCILRRRDALDDFFDERNIDVEYFSRWRFSPLTLVDFLGVIRRDRIDVMHLQGYASCTFGRIASALTGVPVIVQCHSVDPRYKLYMALADWVLARRTDRCLTLCQTVRRFVIDRQHVPETRVETFPLGIDLEEFRPHSAEEISKVRESLGIPPGKRIVGTMTRLFEQKGNAYFLEAVSMLARAHPDVLFLVVGEGPLRAELEAHARKLGVDDRVRFLGFRKDAADVLSTFDVAVLASLWEATPLTGYEAMAMGKPIVSTNVDGLSEILEADRTALLVPPRNPDALAREIDRVLRDPALAERLATSALDASRRFGVDDYVRRLEDTYEEVAREGKRHRERRNRRWSFRVRLALTVVLVLALLSQVDLRSILNPLAAAALAPLAIATLLVVADRAVMLWKWHLLLRVQPIAVSFAETARIFFTGNFVGLLLPLGVGPDVLRAAGLGLQKGGAIEAAGSIVAERVLGLVSLLIAALVGLAIAPDGALPAGVRGPAAAVIAMVVVASCIAFFSRRWLERMTHPTRAAWIRRLARALVVYRDRPRLLAAGLGLSLVVQALRIAIVYEIALALGQSIPLAPFVLAVPVTTVASLLPVTLGGFGAREAVYWICFTRLGVDGGVAITLGLLSFVAALVGASPGAFYLLFHRGGGRPARRSSRPMRRRIAHSVRRAAIAAGLVAALVFGGFLVSPGLRSNLPWSKRESFERALLRGSFFDRRLARFGDGETVRFPSQGLTIAAGVTRGAGSGARP
ncbi:MAG: flippase-like domain-containing protein, partial [Planctomycetes bacterium]|nr:flippase-like domain-containing protein [Planctomycetota bacterium]